MYRKTRAFYGAYLALASLAVLGGCGGHTAVPTSGGAPGGNVSAVFTVQWPQPSQRLIPPDANRVAVYVSAVDWSGSRAAIVNRPPAGGPVSVTIDGIVAGRARLFSARAVNVPNLPPNAPPVITNPSQDELLEGTTLAAGAADSVDVIPFSTVNVSITLTAPGEPPGGTTTVDVTINQVVTASFPFVLVLEMIRDQDGNILSNLNAANFEVLEDGQPCVVTDVRTVTAAGTTIAVSLVLDRSGSMWGQPNRDLEAAATTFVNLMAVDDLGEVINFSTWLEVTQPFTSDKAALIQAIQGQYIGGTTALYDAIRRGVADAAEQGGRAAVIAMTDGGENNSVNPDLNDLISYAKSQGIPVFCVGLTGYDLNEPPLQEIAAETGGLYFFAPTSSQLEEIYTRISQQLRAQIQIGFISANPIPSGRTRTVEVRFSYGQFSGSNSYAYTY